MQTLVELVRSWYPSAQLSVMESESGRKLFVVFAGSETRAAMLGSGKTPLEAWQTAVEREAL